MISEAHKFLEKVIGKIQNCGFPVHNWEIDHLCYRTSSQQNYSDTKLIFEKLGTCLIESQINGRLIATFKLAKPIHYKDWIIDLIEVPAPKSGKITPEGFEHIEMVIDICFSDFKSLYHHIEFNESGLSKDLNPEIEVEFNDCAVKFHHKSLEHIINIEKNGSILNFLNESSILKNLNSYNPCLSGTFPLNIQMPTSDLDILFSSKDLDSFLLDTQNLFGDFKNYSQKITEHQGLKSAVIKFASDVLAIELFCQNQDVFRQQANQHFLIEGRLLKIFGENLKEKVIQLKNEGMKTEPAFGEVLGLKDPYRDLLDLKKLSDQELLSIFKDKLISL